MDSFERVVREKRKASEESGGGFFPLEKDFESEATEVERLRAEIGRLRARNLEMMDLLGCNNPDKLIHDLRNVLNEMQLLRLLTKMDA